MAKAEKLTKYVQGTLEAVDGGAMPRPCPCAPEEPLCLHVPAVVAMDPCSRPRLAQTGVAQCTDTPVCVALRLQAAQEVVPDFPEDDGEQRAQAFQQAPRQERTLRRSEVQPQEQDVSSACCLTGRMPCADDIVRGWFRLGIKVMIGQESSASREVTNTRTLSGGPTPALSPSCQHTHALT